MTTVAWCIDETIKRKSKDKRATSHTRWHQKSTMKCVSEQNNRKKRGKEFLATDQRTNNYVFCVWIFNATSMPAACKWISLKYSFMNHEYHEYWSLQIWISCIYIGVYMRHTNYTNSGIELCASTPHRAHMNVRHTAANNLTTILWINCSEIVRSLYFHLPYLIYCLNPLKKSLPITALFHLSQEFRRTFRSGDSDENSRILTAQPLIRFLTSNTQYDWRQPSARKLILF